MHANACTHLIEAPEDCPACPSDNPTLTETERTRCEVYTRVMGYHRPVSAFNAGKQQEHRDRVTFRQRPEQTAPMIQEGAEHD